MSNTKVNVQIGPGMPALLFITFLVLKLTGVIAWSWWWVTAPLWGALAIGLSIALIAGCIAASVLGIGALAAKRAAKKKAAARRAREKTSQDNAKKTRMPL